MNLFLLGIMVSKWSILKTSIIAEPVNVAKLVKATCILHNCLRTCHVAYTPAGFTDTADPSRNIHEGSWRQDTTHVLEDLAHQRQRNYSSEASETREKFAQYFCSDVGQLPWQLEYGQRT